MSRQWLTPGGALVDEAGTRQWVGPSGTLIGEAAENVASGVLAASASASLAATGVAIAGAAVSASGAGALSPTGAGIQPAALSASGAGALAPVGRAITGSILHVEAAAGPDALAISDFKNGEYSIGGVNKTFAEMWVDSNDYGDPAWAGYLPTVIVPGVGMFRESPGDDNRNYLIGLPDLFNSLDCSQGFTVVTDYVLSDGPPNGAYLLLEVADDPDYSQGWHFDLDNHGADTAQTFDFDNGGLAQTTILGSGVQRVAFNLSPEALAVSANGGAAVTGANPMDVPDANLLYIGSGIWPGAGVASIAVEKITFLPLQDAANLSALSLGLPGGLSLDGVTIATGALSASGTGSVPGQSAVIASGALSGSAAGAMAGAGGSGGFASGELAASASASLAATGRTIVAADLSASGAGAVNDNGATVIPGSLSASGAGSVAGSSANVSAGALATSGTASFTPASSVYATGAAVAAGFGVVVGASSSIAEAVGAFAGSGTFSIRGHIALPAPAERQADGSSGLLSERQAWGAPRPSRAVAGNLPSRRATG